ncbi:hypothetical protein [Nannocystis pusilla]|nr:hypothetical protein [Nannocystis pusilla]
MSPVVEAIRDLAQDAETRDVSRSTYSRRSPAVSRSTYLRRFP